MKNRIWIIGLINMAFSINALPYESQKYSVTGPSPYLKNVTERIYKRGGNVVDMAVASAFVLAVVSPFYVSLGAGGFALVDMGKEVMALDFRETAPRVMDANYYMDKSSVVGGTAVGVPGFVSGMWELHKNTENFRGLYYLQMPFV